MGTFQGKWNYNRTIKNGNYQIQLCAKADLISEALDFI